MLGTGCWVLGSGCWVLGSGFWVLGAGFLVLGYGCWVLGIWYLAMGSGQERSSLAVDRSLHCTQYLFTQLSTDPDVASGRNFPD